MADNKKLEEIIENVQEQISEQMTYSDAVSYSLKIGKSASRMWSLPNHSRTELDSRLRLVYWVLESIKHAANDSEQAPE